MLAVFPSQKLINTATPPSHYLVQFLFRFAWETDQEWNNDTLTPSKFSFRFARETDQGWNNDQG